MNTLKHRHFNYDVMKQINPKYSFIREPQLPENKFYGLYFFSNTLSINSADTLTYLSMMNTIN